VEEVYPYPLPDLFAGTQLVVVGRYRQGGETDITLSGEVNGRPQTFRYDGVRFRQEGGDEFIARLWAMRKIGYLLQQIRLHGEDQELIDEIVELSIRYGIITPYTSFLVEETERALREEGRQAIAQEAQATAAPAAPSGQQAVERSEGENALSGADAAAAPEVPPGIGGGATDQYGYEISPVKYVGDKTFVLNEGAWTDTTFDPDLMTPVPVSFGSDDYFALVAARPEWGRYFALGDHVIVVLDGKGYEVRQGEAPPVEVPEARPTQAGEAATEPVDAVDVGEPAPEPTPAEELASAPAGATEEPPTPAPAAQPSIERARTLGETIAQAILDLLDRVRAFFAR
jgi:Ca-activated chloride channel family protein